MIYNDPITTAMPRRPLLERRFGIDRVSGEMLLYGLLFCISIVLHFWQLEVKAMHHDESIHAWMSYKFFTGANDFTCAGHRPEQGIIRQSTTYCYDPVYHGPSLYILTLLAYVLFGDGDAQARLPMALAGIGLVPMAWTLRPFIGRKGALLAAGLMTISPSLLYYTRFARHDALVLLWSLFMVVGLFKFLREGGAANLSLAAAGLALTWATHELVFILIFIGASFFGLRLAWEWHPRVFLLICALALAFGLGTVGASLSVSKAASPALYGWLQRLLGPSMMLGVGALLIVPISYAWEPGPLLRDRLVATWQTDRGIYGAALATFLTIFTLLFTTFFAYPRGFLDGWYQGINYWLLSQHEYARGGQPWFYYLMLLPIYDLLALVFGLVGVGWLLTGGLRRRGVGATTGSPPVPANGHADSGQNGHDGATNGSAPAGQHHGAAVDRWQPPLLVFFLAYWFVEAFVSFSWAGEKMPWLLTHISLPATLLAAWVLGQLIRRVPWRELRHDFGWTVPLLTLVVLLALLVAAYAFSGGDQTVAGLRTRLRGLIPILVAGACLFGLLTISARFGARVVVRLAALTCGAVLLLYGIRAATQVVYRNPDTPIDPLIYTQTAPDVPILVRQIKQLAINQTRNTRTADDPTGGLSMPVVLDGGASKHGGEGSLAWPMQWYLRHFKPGSIRWLDVDANPTIDPSAGVVVLYAPHVTAAMRDQLDADFVRTSEGVFNWWFPEHTGSYDPERPEATPARGYKSLGNTGDTAVERVWNVLSWPFSPSNWRTLASYMLYRELPLELDGRNMEVFVRRDLAPGAGAAQTAQVPTETVVAEPVVAQGQLNNPRGITRDSLGNLYIADTGNHRIVVLAPDGSQLRTIGSFGNGAGELNEPSGVAVDQDGNVYVADTWNARVAKFGPDGTFITTWGGGGSVFGEPVVDPATGRRVERFATDTKGDGAANAANPLAFFGPRNVLVNGDRVYIADTGNTRVVVTDREGNFLQQFGSRGTERGQMQEPIGLGIDERGQLYIGDTWNSRIQVYQTAADGAVEAAPLTTFEVKGWAANSYNDPYIAVAPDGRVWASQGARNTIAEFDPAHQYVRRLKGEPGFTGPKGLVLSSDDELYVANSGIGELLRLRLR